MLERVWCQQDRFVRSVIEVKAREEARWSKPPSLVTGLASEGHIVVDVVARCLRSRILARLAVTVDRR
jgi:hypothetical protein